MGHIFCLMGKSSSGKDTIYREIKKALPKLQSIVLYTTRPIRAGEQEGREYHFAEEAELSRLATAGKVIELREYHTACGVWQYATVEDGQVNLARQDYLVIGTLESYEKMRAYYGKQALVPLYIEVEDGERLTRALAREKRQEKPRYEEMCRRFLADQRDFSEERLRRLEIDRRFENRKQDVCRQEVLSYIRQVMVY